jgi:hypothetical protein
MAERVKNEGVLRFSPDTRLYGTVSLCFHKRGAAAVPVQGLKRGGCGTAPCRSAE